MENSFMSSKKLRVELSSSPEEDEYWITFAKSLISDTIKTFDNRAQFMITTGASLLTADFAVLLVSSNFSLITIFPQLFFVLSVFSFILSLFPRQYRTNPWKPDSTKLMYYRLLDNKRKWHLFGFSCFFVGLISITMSSLLQV